MAKKKQEPAKPLTKTELMGKIKALGKIDSDTKKGIVCQLIGHSSINTMCFGYVYCARCGDQIGDNLMGMFSDDNQVVVGHNCDVCRTNYDRLTWRDKYLCPNPFTETA